MKNHDIGLLNIIEIYNKFQWYTIDPTILFYIYLYEKIVCHSPQFHNPSSD